MIYIKLALFIGIDFQVETYDLSSDLELTIIQSRGKEWEKRRETRTWSPQG